jgi:hypothetical protein
VLAVYESPQTTLKKYLASQAVPYTQFIPDQGELLPALYGGALYDQNVHRLGSMSKVGQSKKLTAIIPKQDYHANCIGAAFLISPDGRLVRVRYHRYLREDLTLTNLLSVAGR